MKSDPLGFITAPRFWCLFALSLVTAMGSYGVLTPETVHALQLLFGGFITVRSVDRSMELLSTGTTSVPPPLPETHNYEL